MNAPRSGPTQQALCFSLAVAVLLSVALGGSLALFAGCGLSTGGIPALDGGTACTMAGQCDDMDPCTADDCSAGGTCTHVPVANGPAPASSQVQGDCHTVVCNEGQPTNEVDDTDVGNSDNPCVVDECSMGVPLQDMTKNNMQQCMSGGLSGSCNDGSCGIVCTMASQCVQTPPNPCTTPTCNGGTGLCEYPQLPDGTPTPGVSPTMGDCHVHICLGGVDTDQEDDSNVPAMMGDCQDPICKAGVPGQSPHALNHVCSTYMTNQPGYCDGNGTCRQCTLDNECGGTITDCEHPACNNFVCGTAFAPNGTLTSVQNAGPCKSNVCDGAGNVVIIDSNTPPNSGTVCISDTCNAGNVVMTDHPGTMCGTSMGMPELCNAMGQCGCQMNGDCTPPSTCGGGGVPLVCGCTPPPPAQTCMTLGKTCGPSFPDGCYGMIPCNDGKKNGTETDIDCGGVAAPSSTCAVPCAQGKACVVGSDCQGGLFCVDGFCCNTACNGNCQACSAAAKGQGSNGVCGAVKSGQDPHNQCPMAQQSTCGDVGGCNGAGACTLYPNGDVCVAASCKADGITLVKADLCDGNGNCKPPGTPTQDCSPYACSGGACKATCTSDGDCAGTAFCNPGASPRHCMNKLTTGTAGCAASDQCTTGVCGNNGVCCAMSTACANMGGACGNTGCATGSGACTYPASGTACGSMCSGGMLTPETCNGSGTCNAGVGAPCPNNTQCESTSICWPGCGAGAGADDAKCPVGSYCDGVGVGVCQPQKMHGDACTASDQCQGGFPCLGGFCCATACNGSDPTCGGACVTGTGACTFPAALTVCGTASTCTGGGMNMVMGLHECDGAGTCQAIGNYSCSGSNMCSAGTGCTMCGMDNDCTTYGYCNGIACTAKGQFGAACSMDKQCLSNSCHGNGNTTCN